MVTSPPTERVDWVDYAKGFCICFVVMMHATLGVEAATGREGWLHQAVAFAQPFRMPDFFLISGLFVARVIERDWRSFLDSKVVHFAYFYLLWLTIQFAVKAPVLAHDQGWWAVALLYLEALVQPFGTLWFIYLLPIFFVLTKLTRRVPAAILWPLAAALEIAPIASGFVVVDEFAQRFVYFYTGYLIAPRLFALATAAQNWPSLAIAGLLWWGLINGLLVAADFSTLPLVSLTLGLAGAAAVVSLSALLAKSDLFAALRYCGRYSLNIYLAFFLPMAATRVFFIKTGLISDVGTLSAIVTVAAIIGALAMFWVSRATPLRFLFERPARLRLTAKRPLRLQTAG